MAVWLERTSIYSWGGWMLTLLKRTKACRDQKCKDLACCTGCCGRDCMREQSIEVLNNEWFCYCLDTDALHLALELQIGPLGLLYLLQQRCSYLFATRPVFLLPAHRARMARPVRAIESVVALPAFREDDLAMASPIARHNPRGAKCVVFGYDFHVSVSNFGLIEIITSSTLAQDQ